MGFIRRFGYYPSNEVITQIEGVIIADLPPPGSVQGRGVGTAGLVGEFADMTYATQVSSSGVVSSKIRPFEIFTTQDLIDKAGGFDETIGDFGVTLGNGFQSLRSKKFSRLIIAPVNLSSSQGTRYMRDLPLNTSPTDTNPIVPVQGATVAAGREFRSGSGRVRVAGRVLFTANQPIATGTGGSTGAGGSAATQTFTGTTNWATGITRPDGSLGAAKGDILVIGNNNAGAKQPTAEAGTYRVQTTPSSGNTIVVERLDGANFAWTSQTNVPWRLHIGSDADSAPVLVPGAVTAGGYNASEVGGYTVPTRPITNSAGAATDGSYTASTLLAPAVTPPAATGSSWDPLSGLTGRVMPGGSGGLTFTAAVQKVNATQTATIDALYIEAIDACQSDDQPQSDINILWAARKSTSIRNALYQHVLTTSGVGVGRMALFSPPLDQQTLSVILGSSDPGVGAIRNQRVIYTWPGARTLVPEAVGFRLKTSDGQTTIDGVLDETFDSYYASVLSVLAPERNPGQAAPPIPDALAAVRGFQRGVSGLGMNQYIALKAAGVSALRIDRNTGPQIQSGITTSLTSGEQNVNRRRMSDFIEDSLAGRLASFAKLPITNQFKDSVVGETVAFLDELLSPGNPPAQRISDYQVDDVSGNTPALEAQGIFVLIVRVRLLATGDFIVLQAEIGQNVQILPLAA